MISFLLVLGVPALAVVVVRAVRRWPITRGAAGVMFGVADQLYAPYSHELKAQQEVQQELPAPGSDRESRRPDRRA